MKNELFRIFFFSFINIYIYTHHTLLNSFMTHNPEAEINLKKKKKICLPRLFFILINRMTVTKTGGLEIFYTCRYRIKRVH